MDDADFYISSGVASFSLLALAVRSLILLAARFASVWSARLVRALRLRALALQRSMMVAAASIAGCRWTKLGEGWSGELGSEEEEWKSADATVNDLRCTRAFWECS